MLQKYDSFTFKRTLNLMKSNLNLAIKTALFSGALLTAPNVLSADKELLDTLLSNGSINKAQYEKLSHSVKEETKTTPDLKKSDKNGVNISLKGGHFKIKSKDGNFTMGIGGRMMMDAGWFDHASTDINGSRYHNGAELHRFRIHMKGKLFHDWKYQFAYDFGGGGTIKDAWLSYTGLEELLGLSAPLIITVGNDKEPLGLEYVNSSKYLTFLERGLSQTFAPERAIGVSLRSHGELGEGGWTFWGGWYGNDVNKTKSSSGGGDKPLGSQAVAARVTYAPLISKRSIIHFGGSFEQRYYNGSYDLKFKARPEQHRASNFTGQPIFYNAKDTTKFGLEASGTYGPFSLQGEYFNTHVNTTNGVSENMDAWYVFTSWFITGESRRYKAHEGAFTRVKPNQNLGDGGWGAFEVAYRFSYLDLSSNQSQTSDSGTIYNNQGGRRHNSTIGLNWYPTSNIKFMTNYVWAAGAGYDKNGLFKPNQTYSAFQLRAQVDF